MDAPVPTPIAPSPPLAPLLPADSAVFQFSDHGFKPIKVGSLEIRLAETAEEVLASQRLRYDVFYKEMGATPIGRMAELERDYDLYDQLCDHLLVFDHARPMGDGHSGTGQVVGTYRMITRETAEQIGSFYSANEYDISKILAYPGPIVEFGRSCVAPDYRTVPVLQLLWRGLAVYIFTHGIELVFGVASFPGIDLPALAEPLSFLYHHQLAPAELRAVCLPEYHIDMNIIPATQINMRSAMQSLPPLIKGYLRAGAVIGDGAYIDRQWNSVDVFVCLKTDELTPKYLDHYERDFERTQTSSS
jgi:putative hemolysin